MTEYHLRFSVGSFRPTEPPLLQALRTNPQPTAILEQQLQAIALPVSE
jgi:hypothetical protein